MFLTPFLFALVPPLLRFSEKRPLFGLRPGEKRRTGADVADLRDHIILCGFGPTGRDLALTFQEEKIPFILLEMNPQKVKEARKTFMQAIYGDAANEEALKHAGIGRAKSVVVSFHDPLGIAQIIRVVQRLNPNLLLVVRTRFERDVARLYDLGSDIVVIEEWEASHELHRTVLEHVGVPPEKVKIHLKRITARKELIIDEAILNRIRRDI